MRKTGFVLTLIFVATYSMGQSIDSLDIKIGQMILIGVPKAELDDLVLEEVRSGKVGALIFFEKNIPNQLAQHDCDIHST